MGAEQKNDRPDEKKIVLVEFPKASKAQKKKLPKGIYLRGATYWIRYTTASGKQEREKVGYKLAEAETLLGKRRSEVFAKTHYPDRDKRNPTVGEVLSAYLDDPERKQNASHRDDLQRARRIAEFFKEDRRVRTIQVDDVRKFISSLLDTDVAYGPVNPDGSRDVRKMSNATVNRHFELFRAAIRSEVGTGPDWNPFERKAGEDKNKKIKKLKSIGRDIIIPRQQYDLLLYGCRHKRYAQLKVAIQVAYHVGMRLGEIVLIHQDWLDEQNELLTLPAAITKTDEARTVPLPRGVIQGLKSLGIKPDGRFFIAKDSTTISKSFTRLVRRTVRMNKNSAYNAAVKKFGEDSEQAKQAWQRETNFHFHDLRHTAATNLRRKGVDILTIKAICGWKSLEMVERYNNVDVDDMKAAVAKVTIHEG